MGKAHEKSKNNLQEFRRIFGETQQDIANFLGLKKTSNISRWEQGTVIPKLDTLIRLSIHWHTTVDRLYLGFRQKLAKEESKKCKHPHGNSKNKINTVNPP